MPASACLGPVRVYVTETARRETSMLGSRGCSRLALLLGGPRASRASAILAPPLSRGRPTLPLLSANPVGITLPSLASIPSVVRLSSSLAGMESAGLPRMQRTASGQSQGVAKGGKGRKNLGGVLAIKNTWNNTLVSISNTNYKQLGFVSGGAQRHSMRVESRGRPWRTSPLDHRALSRRHCRLQEVKTCLTICDGKGH